jgi:hypothetical protein
MFVEMNCEAERVARVIFIASRVRTDGPHTNEQVIAEGGDEWSVPAKVIVQSHSEGVFRLVLIGCFVHGACLAADHLAGHSECLAWGCRGFFELNAAILIRFGGKNERVYLIAKLDGELEERAGVLSVDIF